MLHLHVLCLVSMSAIACVSNVRSQSITDSAACFLKMTADAQCPLDIAKSGYLLKDYTWCLITAQKVCDFAKNEFCAQELLGQGNLLDNVIPICRPLPESCKRACQQQEKSTATSGATSRTPTRTSAATSTNSKAALQPPTSSSGYGLSRSTDQHKFCCFWAQAGECTTNSFWMIPNCFESCGPSGNVRQRDCPYKFTGRVNSEFAIFQPAYSDGI